MPPAPSRSCPVPWPCAWGYRRHLDHTRRWLILLIVPCLLGGIVGALLVTRLPDRFFSALVPWLLLLAATLFLIDTLLPKKKLTADDVPVEPSTSLRSMTVLVLFQFVVAIYGGYFGAGMGILMLSSLAMMGIGNIHQMNGLKTLLGFLINGVAVTVFVLEDKVVWTLAIAMAVTATIGGYLGARIALRIQPRYVRWSVIFIGFGLAVYYFIK